MTELSEPTTIFQKLLNYKYIIIIIICILIVGFYYYKNKITKVPLTSSMSTTDFTIVDTNNNLIKVKGTLVASKKKIIKKTEMVKEESDIEDEDDEIIKHNLTPSEMKEIASKLAQK